MSTLAASIAILLASALLACGGPVERSELTRDLGSDRFSLGSRVHLANAAKGDVLAAGERVSITALVPGDALVAGGTLDLKGPFGADLYAAGGRVDLDGEVAGSLRAAGGTVQLGPATQVRGATSIAGAEARIEGTLQDYLQVAAAATHLDANVAGDVEVSGGSLELGPKARVQGSLTFHGAQPPVISSEARVQGEIRHLPEPAAPAWQARIFSLVWALGLALLGALGFAVLPGLSGSLVSVANEKTIPALLLGAGLLIGVPLSAVLSFLSVLGAPLALVMLALYALCLPLGYVISGMAISDRLWRRWRPGSKPRSGQRLLALAIVLALLGGLSSVPVLGGMLLVLLVSIGLGSMALHAASWFRSRHPGEPAPPRQPDLPLPQQQPSPGA